MTIDERLADLVRREEPSSGGGHIVPDGFVGHLAIVNSSAWLPFTDEILEDMGYPPRAKGLRYWQRLERQAVAAARPKARLRRRVRRYGAVLADVPRRLSNARAALSGDWERSRDDDY